MLMIFHTIGIQLQVPSSSDVPPHTLEQDCGADESEASSYQQQNLQEACAYEQQNSQQQGTHEKQQQKPGTLLQPDKEEASKCAKYHKSKQKLLCYQIIDGKQKYIEDYQIPEIGTKNLGCVFYLRENVNTENYMQSLKQDCRQQVRKSTTIKHGQKPPKCGSSKLSTTSINKNSFTELKRYGFKSASPELA